MFLGKYVVFLLTLTKFSKLVNGLYIQHENEKANSKTADSSIIENLKINFVRPKNYENSSYFPSQFFLNFKKFNKNFNVSFKLLTKIDQYYPLKSVNVYVIDKKLGRPIKKSNLNKIDDNYALYTEEGGLSYAILIRNQDKNQNTFRLIATLHKTPENSESSETIFDIVPLKVTSKTKKRNLIESNNDHIIFKRETKKRDFLFRSKRQHLPTNYEDYLVLNEHKDKPSIKNNETKTSHGRVVKSEPHKLYVETLLVTELSFYNHMKKYTGINDQVVLFEYMKIYLSHVMNGVNLRYKHSLMQDPDLKIVVKLTNFLFLTEPVDIQWANASLVGDPKYPTNNGYEVLLAKKTLNAFTSYMNSKKFDFEYDHAAALFSKDLWGEPENSLDATYEPFVAGFASLGEICGKNRYSINEEFGGFQNTGVIAHEIAHNLGSFHDGEGLGVDCPLTDNYIMSPNQVNSNIDNINKFSPCSIRQFKNTLLELDYTKISAQAQCLTNAPVLDNQPLETILAELVYPGHIWSPDDQCKMRMGHEYTFCQDQLSNICSVLFCRNATDIQCSGFVIGAAEGTYCGYGKMCIEGACVKHAYLDPPPSFSSNHLYEDKSSERDHCLYGDYDLIQGPYYESFLQSKFGFIFPKSQVTCQEILDHAQNNLNHAASAYCEDYSFRTMCCNTCKKYNALICTDQLYQCPQYTSVICESGTFDAVPVSAICQETCGLCTGSKACVDLYEFCSIYANKCENGTISNIPIGLVCAKSCGDCTAKPLKCENSEYLCKNGATCVNTDENYSSLFGFKCACPLGYYGEYCEKKNPCLPNPCNNGGSCQQLGSYEYFCSCTNSCSGFNCNSCHDTTTQSTNSESLLISSNSAKTTFAVSSTTSLSSTTLNVKTTKPALIVDNDGIDMYNECQDMPGKEFQCKYYAVVFDFCKKYSFVNGIVFTEMCPKTCHICDQTTTTKRATRKKVTKSKLKQHTQPLSLEKTVTESIIQKKNKALEENNIKMKQAREEQARRLEKQKKAREEEERRLAKEKKAKEELERVIKERKAKRREEKEKKKKEEAERKAKEERERLEAERKAREELNQILQEQKARLREEEIKRKQQEKEEREQKERLLKEKELQEELQRLLKAAKEEEERIFREREEHERLLKEKLEREEKERVRVEMERMEEARREEQRILKEKQAKEEFERLLKEARAEEERKAEKEHQRLLEEARLREEEAARLLKIKKAKEEEEQLFKIKKAQEEQRRLLEEKRLKEEDEARLLKIKKAKEEEERIFKIKEAQEEQERILKEKRLRQEESARLLEKEREKKLEIKKAKEEEERILKIKKTQEEKRRILEEKRLREEEVRILKEKKAKEEQERLFKIQKAKQEQETERVIKEKKLREENERRLEMEKYRNESEKSHNTKKEQDRLLKEKKLKEERDRILNEIKIKEEEARASLERFLKEKHAREEEERIKSLHLNTSEKGNSLSEYVTSVCEDSGWNSCAKWATHCDLLRNHFPHPCRKTCKLCI